MHGNTVIGLALCRFPAGGSHKEEMLHYMLLL